MVTSFSSPKKQTFCPKPDTTLSLKHAPKSTIAMKISGDHNPHTRRKTRPKIGAPVGKRRSRPETPLIRWKFKVEEKDREDEKVEKSEVFSVSARTLAAGLWRLQLPEVVVVKKSDEDQLGFQHGIGHVGVPLNCLRRRRQSESEAEDLLESPCSVTGPRKGSLSKLEPSFQFSNTAMEGATKWNPICSKTADDARQLYGYMKPIEQQVSAVSLVTALEAELEQARARIQELETERKSSKKNIEHFLKKLSEERSEWRKKEHEKVRAIIDDAKNELNQEKKNRKRLEIVNSKLVNELAEAKVSAKRFMQAYEKERKERQMIEEVCEELAKEIGEDKAEAEALKRDSVSFQEEVEEERKMLQMAEVWREERVQMKLIDAKVALEEKYSEMKKLVADLETFVRSKIETLNVNDLREAEILHEAASSINIQEITDFSYEPANPNDNFSMFQDVNFNEIEPCNAYSPASKNQRSSNACLDQDGDEIEEEEEEDDEDGSGWETASQVEDRNSGYSPNGSAPSVNKIRRGSNASRSGTESEENIGDVCLVRPKQLKKSLSISRLWKSCPNNNGENYKVTSVEGKLNGNERLSNGRKSMGSNRSQDQGLDLVEQWSSPDTGNQHITRGGCIEWPLNAQKSSLKARLLEARMESQKVQLRQVLKQKI